MQTAGGWRLVASLALVAAATVWSGCAQDVGDIDRTQPDKIEKSLFQSDDEWFYRQTITDTDVQASAYFESAESPLKRVRWEITEDTLYAFTTVELLAGIDDGYSDEDTRRLGAVAAFPITSHFDVQREYNASTGEQSNVIVENSSDRPWYEREYMRVDWSTNLISNPFFDYQGSFGRMSAAAYQIPQDDAHANPDRTRITDSYIDATTEYHFDPDVNHCYQNLGSIEAAYTCEAGKLRIRNSFLRIDPDDDHVNDYVPFEYTDNVPVTKGGGEGDPLMRTNMIYDPVSQYYVEVECNEQTIDFLRNDDGGTDQYCRPANFGLFKRFGFFRTERQGFSKQYQYDDPLRMHYANRWNIWVDMKDEQGNLIPFDERTPKPIIYHLNAEYPKEMLPAAEEVARQWNTAFRDTVKIATGWDDATLDSKLQEAYGHTDMYRIEHNSCMPTKLSAWVGEHGDVDGLVADAVGTTGGDLEEALWAMPTESRVQLCADLELATGGEFTWERIGDLRYSFFNWVREYTFYWSGYGPSAADPKTGQIISGNANFAGTPLHETAEYYADLIQYMNGELNFDNVRFGNHVRAYLAELKAERASRQQELSPGMPAAAERELVRRAGLDPYEVSPSGFEEAPSFADVKDLFKRVPPHVLTQEADRQSASAERARLQKSGPAVLDDPTIKDFLMSDPDHEMLVQALAHEQYGLNPTPDQIDQAYRAIAMPQVHARMLEQSDRFFAEHNIFSTRAMTNAMESLVTYRGVAEAFRGKSRDELVRYLQLNTVVGTQLHEVGHTVGLRHNFNASMDALNYHDSYWEIQRLKARGELTDEEAWAITGNQASEIAGEAVDYLSEAETRLASVMDYTGDLTGRFSGLGKYDQAAITFVYGEHVERFKKEHPLPNLLWWYRDFRNDYKDLPQVYANAPTSTATDDVLKGIDVITEGREWITIDEAIEDYRQGVVTNTTNWQNGQLTPDTKPWIDRVVPYNFCSDEESGLVLGCDVFDFGANHNEIVEHSFNTYRFFQPFWRYRDQSNILYPFMMLNYMSRMLRTFDVVHRPFRYYSYYRWLDLGAYTDDLREAAVRGINFFGEVISTPEPGRYCKYNPNDFENDRGWYYDMSNTYVPAYLMRDGGQCTDQFDVSEGAGQFYSYRFTDEYNYRLDYIGSVLDKQLAIESMFNISGDFLRSDFITDSRATNVSYWTEFSDSLLDYTRGIILGTYDGFGGVFNPVGGGKYEAPLLVDPRSLGSGEDGQQANMNRVYTPMSWNHRIYTLAYALDTGTSWGDRQVDLADYLAIATSDDELSRWADVDCDGDGTADNALHSFTHPVTGEQYYAREVRNPMRGCTDESIAVDLLEWANERAVGFVDNPIQGRYEQLEEVVARIEMVRQLVLESDASN